MTSGILDIRRLRYISAIAEHGSLSAASRILHVAQPALSYHLSETEKQMGKPLFERSSKGMVPTAIGLLYLEHARLILDAVKLAELDLRRQMTNPQTGTTVKLMVIPSLASTFAPSILESLDRALSDVRIHLIEARTRLAEEHIASGQTDAAIALKAEIGRGELPLAFEELACMSSRQHGHGDDSPIGFAEVAASNLILPSRGNPLREFLELAARKAKLTLNVRMEIDGYEPRRHVVLAGHGTTVVGAGPFSNQESDPNLVLKPIVEPQLRRPIVLLLRDGFDAELGRTIRATLSTTLEAIQARTV